MPTQTNELNVWLDGAPVINMAPNKEFDVWLDNAPVVTIDESDAPSTTTTARRRAFIF